MHILNESSWSSCRGAHRTAHSSLSRKTAKIRSSRPVPNQMLKIGCLSSVSSPSWGHRRPLHVIRPRADRCPAKARPTDPYVTAEELADRLRSTGPLPALAVMDLDHTLFRCYLDMDSVGPPYSRDCEDSVLDRTGNLISLYPQSRLICEALLQAGVQVCVASRSPVESWYLQVLEALELRQALDPIYIHGGSDIGYPGTKLGHFKNITKATGIGFEEMIFMDDEYGNIEDMTAHGVCCHYVRRGGPTTEALEELVGKWQGRNC